MVRTEPLATHSNLMCIWYHDKDISVDVQRQMKIYLHQNFPYSRIFDNKDKLIHYLANKLVIKQIVFIISITNKEATTIEKFVQRRDQFRKSYRLPLDHYTSSVLPNLASVHSMIKTDFATIIEDLRKSEQPPTNIKDTTDDNNTIEESTLAFNTFTLISAEKSFCDLTQESLKFLLFQSLVEVLVRMPYTPNAFEHMWNLCLTDCTVHRTDREKIKKIAEEYEQKKAIYCYTQSSCLFRLINRAFRLEDVERIFRFGCYLADLYEQLELLHKEQRSNGSHNTKTFYRGKRFSTDVLQQFQDNVGHLIAMNGLFSTTVDYDTSTMFAGIGAHQDDYQRVIFEINIDCTKTHLIRPHANIKECSANPDENEVLFFMGFVWKIESMEKWTPNHWYIVLKSCADYDHELIAYIEESRRECTYLTLGNILRELGDYANANNFYERMLDNKNLTDEIRSHVYFNMAMVADDQGAYLQALRYLRQAEEFIKPIATSNNKVLAPSRPLFAHSIVASHLHVWNNKGRCYLKDGNYQSAKESFEAALLQPGSTVERATVLNNYGLLEHQRGNIDKARTYFEEAVQLAINDACVSEFKRNLDAVIKQR
jgi:tetratricopeptide (TPR) repeat protein